MQVFPTSEPAKQNIQTETYFGHNVRRYVFFSLQTSLLRDNLLRYRKTNRKHIQKKKIEKNGAPNRMRNNGYFSLFVCVLLFVSIPIFPDDQGPELPTRSNQEFRPFIRRLPEFKFWYAISKSTVIGIICTFFEVFNIPVFWPILVMYFITLFCITMKRQIKVSVAFVFIQWMFHQTQINILVLFVSLFFFAAYDQI